MYGLSLSILQDHYGHHEKYIRYPDITNDFTNPLYDEEYAKSINNKEEFWGEQAKQLVWSKQPTKILDTSDQYLHRWYTDGEMNISYNCIDRHIDDGRGDVEALVYYSVYTDVEERYTYSQLKDKVGELA